MRNLSFMAGMIELNQDQVINAGSLVGTRCAQKCLGIHACKGYGLGRPQLGLKLNMEGACHVAYANYEICGSPKTCPFRSRTISFFDQHGNPQRHEHG